LYRDAHVLERPVHHVRVDRPRRNAIHRDPVRRRFDRQHLRHADDPELRRAIRTVLRDPHPPRCRRDVDDPSAVAALDHRPHRPAREQIHAIEVHIDDVVPLVVVDLPQIVLAAVRKPRIVHDNVDASKRIYRLRDHALDIVHLREIGIDADRAPSHRLDLHRHARRSAPTLSTLVLRELLRRARRPRRHNVRALLRKPQRDPAPDPAHPRRPRHDRHSAFKPHEFPQYC
jgi:hypothetical protein